MEFFKMTSVYNVISVLLILCVSYTISQAQSLEIEKKPRTIPGCSGYVDLTESKRANNNGRRTLTIPKSRTSQVTYPSMPIENSIEFLIHENQKLKCTEEKAVVLTLPFQVKLDSDNLKPRNFSYLSNESTKALSHSYFTSAGYFYDNTTSNYYKPDGDYCVASYSTESITLQVCPVSRDCSSSALPNAFCVPKCCGIDEVLLVSGIIKRQCVKTAETLGVTPWIPPIFRGPSNPHKKVDGVQNNLIFQMASLPKDCNLKILDDGRKRGPLLKYQYASDLIFPNNESYSKNFIKLAAPPGEKNGVIQLLYLYYASRSWKEKDNLVSFCVDGFYINSEYPTRYKGKEDDFVVLLCDVEKPNMGTPSNAVAYTWAYVIVSLVDLLLLLATIIFYLVLFKKQNLHGLTILSYSVATFASYLALIFPHLIFLFAIDKAVGLHTRGLPCYTIAVLSHYFSFASYFWLTVMNFDLWLSFSAIRVVPKDEKEYKKLSLYSLFAWGVPIIIITTFAVVDEVYRDPTTEVPVPNYATTTCFLAPEFRGEYLYIPVAIILAVNILLIALTMKIFIEARCRVKKAFAGGVSNANNYSAKLFCKLFIVMGGVYIVDFLTWYYNNSGGKPWSVVVLEIISNILPPLVMFILFCLNERTLNQMREKYPAVAGLWQSVMRCCKRKEENSDDYSASSNKTQTSSLEMNIRER